MRSDREKEMRRRETAKKKYGYMATTILNVCVHFCVMLYGFGDLLAFAFHPFQLGPPNGPSIRCLLQCKKKSF